MENISKKGIRRVDTDKVTRHTSQVKQVVSRYIQTEAGSKFSETVLNSSLERLCHLVAAECGAVLEKSSKLYANETADAKTVSSILRKSDYFIPTE